MMAAGVETRRPNAHLTLGLRVISGKQELIDVDPYHLLSRVAVEALVIDNPAFLPLAPTDDLDLEAIALDIDPRR
jgi:hypothetical protein